MYIENLNGKGILHPGGTPHKNQFTAILSIEEISIKWRLADGCKMDALRVQNKVGKFSKEKNKQHTLFLPISNNQVASLVDAQKYENLASLIANIRSNTAQLAKHCGYYETNAGLAVKHVGFAVLGNSIWTLLFRLL